MVSATQELEATHLRDRRWCVRPVGRCGTCGWVQGRGWDAVFVNAASARVAIDKARGRVWS